MEVLRFTAFDLEEVELERLITCPFLESYVLPELSTILVLGVVDELLLLTLEPVLPETALLVEVVALLPEIALLLLLLVALDDDLPDRLAIEERLVVAALLL